jgi:hypothetical protein
LRESAARDHADDLEAVAALEIGFGPLGAEERGWECEKLENEGGQKTKR